MPFNRQSVTELLESGSFFWLDLHQPRTDDFKILREVFGFHPLAIEDSEHFDQRAKLDDYDDFLFLVVYGACPDSDRLVEVHCFYSERFLVTVHRDDSPAFAEIRRRYQGREAVLERPSLLLYRIVDGLVASFFPILAEFDDRIDGLENAIFIRANDRQLQEIFQMKRLLVGMRKAVTPQRDTFASLMGGLAGLPGLVEEDERYFRDVYDHLIRLNQSIDSLRETVTTATQVNLTLITIGETEVTKRLAAWGALIAVPTFIASLYGMNFKHMPELEWSFGYPMVLGVMGALNAYFWYRFRKAGWL